jgi:eukaryotic-like serine/threonine-protein kinase
LSDFPASDAWRRVDALFDEALDWPEAEREERLRAACRGDVGLYEAVSRLFEAVSGSGGFLETPPPLSDDAIAHIERLGSADRDLAGERAGRYRILSRLGRGGMASVWLAEREDGLFRRRVALKIVRAGLDTEDVLARFHAERRILSSLEHPNIARLYDGGSTEDGRPFLALEYVEGRPIDEYCDDRRHTVDERLRLFLEVGRAVQFAHGRLVVHRDIKPSNILVGEDGVPKLLDFGIAKLLDPTEEVSHHTRTGLQPLTLRCASPEQVRGEPVTTASDVYQLGVLLYGLLTGAPPYDTGDGSRWAAQEAILRTPPRPPSRAGLLTAPEVARRRENSPQRLSRRLAGDLDTILLKALEKEPADRYASAIELVEDVRRHLDGRPIAARRAGVSYRVRKYFRRNRWAAPALAAATLALAGYVATVERHGRQLERERNLARAEASRAEAVRDFLTDIFETARPDAGENAMTVGALVDRAAERVDEEFSPHPSVLAELSGTLGSIYIALGRHDEATGHLERAVFLLEGEPDGPERDVRLATALKRLGAATRGVDVDSGGRLRARAYELAASIRPATSEAALVILETAHDALPADRDSAKRARLGAIEVLRRDAERREVLAGSLQDVAHDGGENAIPFQEEALRIRRELFGDKHSSVAASLNDLAMIYEEREPGAGDSLMLRAIEIDREVLGPAHTTTLSILNNYAWMLAERGDREGAVEVFRQVLQERDRAYPDERWRLAYPLHGLGVTLMELDRHAEAEETLRETVRMLQAHGGEEGRLATLTGIARTSLARCLLAQGLLDESERLTWSVLEQASSKPGLNNVADGAKALLQRIAVARSEAALRP